jgi:hypothetical protein
MQADIQPSITVLGTYTPMLPSRRFEQFVVDYMARFGGDFPVGRRAEIEAELRARLAEAVLIEVGIRNADESFDVGAFTQPNPAFARDFWQVAWAEVYLTTDGNQRVSVAPERTGVEEMRLVFWLHFFDAKLPLSSSYGAMPCPPVLPMPDRLWTLAPYDLPD